MTTETFNNMLEAIITYTTHAVVNPAVLRDMILTIFGGGPSELGPGEDGKLPK